MTIHNLKFQGKWGIKAVQDITGLGDPYFTADGLEAYGDSNYLKGGIVYADMVTTVSDTYADETDLLFVNPSPNIPSVNAKDGMEEAVVMLAKITDKTL